MDTSTQPPAIASRYRSMRWRSAGYRLATAAVAAGSWKVLGAAALLVPRRAPGFTHTIPVIGHGAAGAGEAAAVAAGAGRSGERRWPAR